MNVLIQLDLALIATCITILGAVIGGIWTLHSDFKRNIIESQQIKSDIIVLTQRLAHSESRLDRIDNFIASNSGLKGIKYD